MTDPDLARRFQEAAEACWLGRPVLATITPYGAVYGVTLCVWEVELSDTLERARLVLTADATPTRATQRLRAWLGKQRHAG